MATTDTTLPILTDTEYAAAGLRTTPAVGDFVRTTFEDDDATYRVTERSPNRHGAYLLTDITTGETGSALYHELYPVDLPTDDEN